MTSSINPQTERLLITGASGFLGTTVVRLAIEQGFAVRCTGRSTRPAGLGLECPDVEYYQADLLTDDLKPLLGEVTCVIHLAGLAHVFDKSKSESQFMAVNAHATERLAQECVQAGIRHMVLASSVAVYGGNVDGPCSESSPCNPVSAYARSKYEGERLASSVAKAGMKLTILRLATLFGPGDPGNVARLLSSIDQGKFVWIGKGENRKSLVYRDDAAQACLDAVRSPPGKVQTYNVSAPPETMHSIVEYMAKQLGKSAARVRVPAWLAQSGSQLAAALCLNRGPAVSINRMIRTWLAEDVYMADLIQQELGWQAQTPLETGLGREVDWYKSRSRAAQ